MIRVLTQASQQTQYARGGVTVLELMISIMIASLVIVGMSSTIMMSNDALMGNQQVLQKSAADELMTQLMSDVRHSVSFSERTATAVTMAIPDQNGGSGTDTVRYAWTGLPSAQLTYQRNGGTIVTLADDVQDFDLNWMTRYMPAVDVVDGNVTKLLLIATDEVNPTSQENLRRAMFEAWGYEVQLLSQTASQSEFDTAVLASHAVYIPETIDAAVVGNKLVSASIGIVNEEPDLHDEFGFAETVDASSSLTDIDIKEETHYITHPFDKGDIQIFSNGTTVQHLASGEPSDLLELARRGGTGSNASEPALSALATGYSMSGGGTTAGRRVQLPWGHSGMDINNLHANGITILRRSIAWATGEGADGGPLPPQNFGYESAFASVGADISKHQLATRVTLTESGTLTSISAYVTGDKSKDYGFAIYSNVGGEPGTLLAATNFINSTPTGWKTIPVSPVALPAGDYWLALTFDRNGMEFFYEPTGGETRIIVNDAVANGWLNAWGSSAQYNYRVSIYGTYTPD